MTRGGRKPKGTVSRDARRWHLLRPIVTALVALFAATAPRQASAYCRTTTCPPPLCDPDANGCPSGMPIAWQTSCVSYSMQYRASKQINLATASSVMEKAFAVWQNVSCPATGIPAAIRVDHHFGDVACNLHEYNQTDSNANSVIFRDDKWPYEETGNVVLGLTTITYSRKTGAIFDADMEINATQPLSIDDPVPITAYDLQSIVTHEVGHFLGMAHSHDPNATMQSSYTAGTSSFRTLGADDIQGICAVYPAGAAVQCDFNPRQGFSPVCGIFPSGGGGRCSLARLAPTDRGTDANACIGLAGGLGGIALFRRRGRRSQAEGR